MSPILHLMRHGQGFHSAEVTKDGHLIRDAHLTDKGKEQCRQRCEAFSPRHDSIDLLLSSPLRRALQTCQIAMAPCLQRGLRILALPQAEEVSTAPADTGSPLDVLRDEFGAAQHVDFGALHDGWYRHEGEFATNAAAVLARAKKLRAWIRARPEREVVLVSHGFFNHFLTGEVDERGEQTTPWWNEAELRTYEFMDEDDEMAMVRETRESRAARGLLDGGDA